MKRRENVQYLTKNETANNRWFFVLSYITIVK